MNTVLQDEAYLKLKQVIAERGIKVKFVAHKIGISPNYLGQVLNGSRRLSTDVAIKASQVLELPIDYFLKKNLLK